jgi:hypothetical protein
MHSGRVATQVIFEISQQCRDALALLRAAGHESALVFGNSTVSFVILH